jgi:hypothetical protein
VELARSVIVVSSRFFNCCAVSPKHENVGGGLPAAA